MASCSSSRKKAKPGGCVDRVGSGPDCMAPLSTLFLSRPDDAATCSQYRISAADDGPGSRGRLYRPPCLPNPSDPSRAFSIPRAKLTRDTEDGRRRSRHLARTPIAYPWLPLDEPPAHLLPLTRINISGPILHLFAFSILVPRELHGLQGVHEPRPTL